MLALPKNAEHSNQPNLPADYYLKSSLFGYAHVLPDIFVLLLALYGIGAWSWPLKIACALVSTLIGYRMTFIIHDCSHNTLFAHRQENTAIGWICSSFVFVSFPTFQKLHWVHHQHYRREADPQGTDYNGLVPGRDSVLWHLLKPLLMLNVFEKFVNFISVQHCGMTPDETKRANAHVNPSRNLLSALPLANIAAGQLLVIGLTTHGLQFWPGYPLFLGSLVSIGLFLSRYRSYLEHGSLEPHHDQLLIARTHVSNFLERNILSYLLFNFHNEHHRWPQVPSRNLPDVHRDIMSGSLGTEELSRSYLSSTATLLRSCRIHS